MQHIIHKIKTLKPYQVQTALVSIFLILMFTIFPLYYTNQYAEIRHDKLYFFLYAGVSLIFIEGFIFLFGLFSANNSKIPTDKKWYQKLSVTDFAFITFIISCVISTIFSKYPIDAISGTQGRNNGLLLMCIYFGIYIIISRFYKHKNFFLTLFAVTSLIVFALCILNFYYIDPLGMFANYSKEIQMDFTSTIGNRNLMASYCCIAVPVFLMMYMHIESKLKFLYLSACSVGFAALICSNSECGFLGIIPTLAIILIYASKDYKKLFGFFSSVAVMLICSKLLGILNIILIENKNFGTIQRFFVDANSLYIVIAICIIIAFYCYFKIKDQPPKIIFKLLLTSFIITIVTVIGLMIYFTCFDRNTKLGAVTSYLRFSSQWGTHRGFIWIKSFKIFADGSLKDKLFGCGPDNFFSAFAPYFAKLNEKFGDGSTNSAHNELLNYLVTVGLAGVASYLTLTISVIVRAFKKAKENYLAVVFASAIICYLFQSLVNIAQPITTPLLFIFIALTENINKKCLPD